MSGLRPCPFRGGDARAKEAVGACGTPYAAGCSDPECMGHETLLLKPTKEGAMAAWNRRAARTMNDEKRNDVSSKLMDAAKRISKDDVACALNDALHGEEKLSGINESCSTCCSVSLAELADLVKPSCDRDALLALAEELEEGDATYLVSTQYVLDDYARRIREALGVSDG